jgi:hypothetical protein
MRDLIPPSEYKMFWTKVFEIAPLAGDYVEFGVYKGRSLIAAHAAAQNWVNRLLNGRADHLVKDRGAFYQRVHKLWAERKFFGFDSFEGMPESKGVDSQRIIWQKGTFSHPIDAVHNSLTAAGIPANQIKLVKGFFSETLTDASRLELGLKKIAVAHIDSDLYESAVLALNFITPMLQNGTVIVFDDWFAYRGHPLMGEQRAFREWQEKNTEWLITEYASHGPYAKAFIVNNHEINYDASKLTDPVSAILE